MISPYQHLALRPGRDYPIRNGHPWLFSGAFQTLPKDLPAGSVVDVASAQGEWIARGHLSVRNSLAFRVLTRQQDEPIDAAFYRRRIQRAAALRALLPQDVSAYRLIHAEADFLPGVVADRYADWIVLQLHTAGSERDRESIVAALVDAIKPAGILIRNDVRVRAREGLPAEGVEVAYGSVPERIEIREHTVRYLVDPWYGQKTGFFLDQREKRSLVARIAEDKQSLLNCFSYSGGFALAGLSANASLHTVNVDASAPALDLARQNYVLNGLDPALHGFHAGDVNDYLDAAQREGQQFDVVVIDPPAFAKNIATRERALHGYANLNARAANVVAPDGLLLTCSCSGAISQEDFEGAVLGGLLRAGRYGQIAHTWGTPLDHPTLPGFTEDRYLKAILLRLD